MKKNFMKLAGALICIMMSPMFTSCLSEDNPSTSTNSNQADVTIMYYAHGGGNLDPFLIGNIHHMYQAEAESYKNVKVAVEYKFSTTGNLSDVPNEAGITPEGSRTFRLVVDHTKTLKEQLPDAYLPGKNADITHPDSLTNFINWAAKLDQLGKNMREFTDRLCDTYKNGTADQKQKINEVTKNAVKINKERALYDAGRYMEGMRKALPEVFDDAFWAELKESFNNCLAGQYTSKYLLNRNYQVDYSVLLAVKGAYQESTWVSKILNGLTAYEPDGKYTLYDVENGMFKDGVTPDYTLKAIDHGTWGGTLESVYGALAFDKATGWSRWLLLNEQQPSLWCNNEFEFPAPYKE